VTCGRAEELLSDYREGELHPVLRGELETHLRACAECPRLLAALDEVLGLLHAARDRRMGPEIEPAPDLAARAAAAALARGRVAGRARAWMAFPGRMHTLAAGIALFATATVIAGRTALEHRWPQRLLSEAATAGVHLIERKDRAVEGLRMVRVIVGATFAGRVDRVSERVDDYRRLLERRRSAPSPGAGSPGGDERGPSPGAGAVSPGPVSAAQPADWAAAAFAEPRPAPERTRGMTRES
jgi:hypothetical protein